jgi:hypothetical protein
MLRPVMSCCSRKEGAISKVVYVLDYSIIEGDAKDYSFLVCEPTTRRDAIPIPPLLSSHFTALHERVPFFFNQVPITTATAVTIKKSTHAVGLFFPLAPMDSETVVMPRF